LLEELKVPEIVVFEKTLLPADLELADGVFITSSTRDILPVASIEGLVLKHATTVDQTLVEAFRAFQRSYILAAHRTVVAG
jgi:branched-chain amino acid aminotransferase